MVGAPQYFEKEGEIGGAVYVYVNNAGMWDKVTPVRIDGPKDSMFGLAVANLGDINQDGYHGKAATLVLLLVGLYGGFKNASTFGCQILLWELQMTIRVQEKFSSIMDSRLDSSLRKLDRYGGKTVEYSALLDRNLVSSEGISVSLQVLPAMPGVKMFGYSLASNMDLDENSYPDLAVGSLSDAVFVYR